MRYIRLYESYKFVPDGGKYFWFIKDNISNVLNSFFSNSKKFRDLDKFLESLHTVGNLKNLQGLFIAYNGTVNSDIQLSYWTIDYNDDFIREKEKAMNHYLEEDYVYLSELKIKGGELFLDTFDVDTRKYNL